MEDFNSNNNSTIRELQQIILFQKRLEQIINSDTNTEKPSSILDHITSTNTLTEKFLKQAYQGNMDEKFLTDVGHELRTPLVPIMTYVNMLKEGKFGHLNEEQEKKVDIVTQNTKLLHEKIETFLYECTNISQAEKESHHHMKELEQEKVLLKKLNKLLTNVTDQDELKTNKLEDIQTQMKQDQKEHQQKELFLDKTIHEGEKKEFTLAKKNLIIIAGAAMAIGIGFTANSIYVGELIGQQYKVPNLGSVAPSNYVIQNLQGDTVNTWVAWNIENGRTIHVHVTNAANVPQNMIDAVKDAILSTKTVSIDDSLTGKGPKGTSSTYYVGWGGAATEAYLQPTKRYVPQKFDVSGSPDGVSDIEIILTNDVSPDGYSGYTKSLADGNEILKSKITIYKADKLDADRFEAIIRHEFGHALGLAHSTATEDLMSPMLPDYPYISSCDIGAIKGLYDGDKQSKVVCQK